MSGVSEQLSTHEEFFLLALDENGKLSFPRRAIGASIVAELLIRGLAVIEQHDQGFFGHSQGRVRVTNEKPIGEDILDRCLKKMSRASRPKELHRWISKFEWLDDIRSHVSDLLVARNILQKKPKTWFFSRTQYHVLDKEIKKDIEAKIRNAIQTDHFSADTRTSVLIAIASETGVLSDRLGWRMTFKNGSRIREICKHDPTARAIMLAIRKLRRDEKAAHASAAGAASAASASSAASVAVF